jgi:glutamate/tyrosine decarboxylase-like PLP-dependent enzyme
MNAASAYPEKETGLDPENWNDIKNLGYQMIDDMVDYLQHIDQKRVWTAVPPEVKATFDSAIPEQPSNIKDVYQEFKDNIMPYNGGNIHPAYFSWVQGTGTPFGALAELLSGMINSNASVGDQSPLYVDRQVINWCKQMMNYPADASGILVNGASVANVTALIVARNTIIPNAKRKGVRAADGKITAYCSTEIHSCVVKAIEVIGVGSKYLRKIPVNANYEIDLEALKARIQQDKDEGYIPFCIIGTAGTVNTGAIDPLTDLLQIARKEEIWFHIDGAFGALAKLVPAYAERLKVIEEADSIAFDLHKWMYMPYEVGCVLIKDAAANKRAFESPANYLLAHNRGLAAGPEPTFNYGMELSRGFKALKVWMSLKEHGLDRYRTIIEQNISQAVYLGEQISAQKPLELLAAVSMNIVCLRYNPGGLDDMQLDALNKELLMQLHESGVAAPSYTLLDNRYAIRVAITNQRTRKKHLDAMVAKIIEIGNKLFSAQQIQV